MRRYKSIYKLLVALWLILTGGSLLSSASAYPYAQQPAAWSSAPTHNAPPAYQFHSTSAYTPIVGHTNYTSSLHDPSTKSLQGGTFRSNPWDPPTGEEVGQVDTPVGEPFILLVMAAIYLFYILYRKRKNVITNK